MDTFNFTLLLAFVAGVILIMYSAYDFNGNDRDGFDRDRLINDNIESKIKAIDTSVADADTVMGELNDMSNSVFKELDNKYQELLFLYNLIDEKKNEIFKQTENSPQEKTIENNNKNNNKNNNIGNIDILVNDTSLFGHKSKRFKEIMELKNDGLSNIDIAKQLDMGQGEVSLIIELGKGR